jgi:hypothetical protein
MPNSTQTFNINNCNVTPNGNSAQMSIGGNNSQPNQGNWKNNDNQYDYTITLPSNAWQLAPNQSSCGSSLTFTVTKGSTSCTYQLLSTAPLGASSYTVTKSDGTQCLQSSLAGDPQNPDVIINS